MIHRNRILSICFIFILLFGALFGRLIYLQTYKYTEFKQASKNQIRRTIVLPAKRGNITDRNGILLAATIDSSMVYIDCGLIDKPDFAAEQLSKILNISKDTIYERIKNRNANSLLKRRISDEELDALKKLKLRALDIRHDQKRIYLREYLAANLLGFTDQENEGKSGIEQAQDRYLQGISGELIVERDPIGRELYVSERTLKEPKDGNNITLTIDEFLQYIARKYLSTAIQKEKADSGSVIIMDTRTGQILAMVSLPDYNPNRYFSYAPENLRNNAIQTVYEPGSVFKIITVATALDSGLVHSNTTIINGNSFELAKRTIRESHSLKDPERPRQIRDVIIESLNITSAKLALQIGKEKMYEYINRFQLHKQTQIGLYGESNSILKAVDKIEPIDLAVIGFGQGAAFTPLQIVSAINVIANNGIYVKPSIILKISDNKNNIIKDFSKGIEKKQVIKPQTAWEIRMMLQECVQKGTGQAAAIPGYSIGGKTGTSQKSKPGGGYLPNSYVSSFVGIVPGNKPRLTILVVIDNPKKSYYGGDVAAPVFREITREAVRYLAIPEDI